MNCWIRIKNPFQIKKFNNYITVDNYEWLLQAAITFIIAFVPGIKKYLLISIFLFFSFLAHHKNTLGFLRKERTAFKVLTPVLFYVIFGGVLGLLNGNFSSFAVKVSLFFLLPPIMAIHFVGETTDTDRLVKTQFIFTAVWCTVVLAQNILQYGINSEKTETSYAFTMAIFLLYFLYKKNVPCMGIAFILLVLSDKRISYLGLAAAVGVAVVLLLPKGLNRWIKKVIFLVGSSGVFLFIYLVKSGILAAVVGKYQINDMGRINAYNLFKDAYSFSISFLGNGTGFVTKYLADTRAWVANLHSDWLMFYLEIGFLGLMIYLLLSYRVIARYITSQYNLLFVVYIYAFVIYFTDNIAIYIAVLPTFYTIVFATIKQAGKERSKEGIERCRNVIN